MDKTDIELGAKKFELEIRDDGQDFEILVYPLGGNPSVDRGAGFILPHKKVAIARTFARGSSEGVKLLNLLFGEP